MNLLQRIACDIDFNDSEAYKGNSYLPFLGFMCFLGGIMFILIGAVKINNARHQWNLFYDERDRKDLNSPALNKDRKVGIILVIIGLILMVGSYLL